MRPRLPQAACSAWMISMMAAAAGTINATSFSIRTQMTICGIIDLIRSQAGQSILDGLLERARQLVDSGFGGGNPSLDRRTELIADRRKSDQDAVANRGQRNARGPNRARDDFARAFENRRGQLLSSLNRAADQLPGLIED